MSRLRQTVAASASVMAMLAPGIAHAGSNGQQLNLHVKVCRTVEVTGTNQDGTPTRVLFNGLTNGENEISGWWWKGRTLIDCFDIRGVYRCTVTTDVPVTQESDWWDVFVDPGRPDCTAQESAETAVTVFADALVEVEEALVDPTLCLILVELTEIVPGGIPGVVEADPDGDLYVAGTPVWDCPPYGDI